MLLVILTGELKKLDTAEYKGCSEVAELELLFCFFISSLTNTMGFPDQKDVGAARLGPFGHAFSSQSAPRA